MFAVLMQACLYIELKRLMGHRPSCAAEPQAQGAQIIGNITCSKELSQDNEANPTHMAIEGTFCLTGLCVGGVTLKKKLVYKT